jgi:uncharacterized membrane protein
LIAVKYGKNFALSYALMVLTNFIPTWSIAAYFSTNLVFDGILYDSILVVSCVAIFAFLGQTEGLSFINWCGIVLVVLGLIMTKVT